MRHVAAAALIFALLSGPALAHGGQCKGPSDAGGPSGAGGGAAAPPTNPGGAAAPGPGAPSAGAPSTGPTASGAGRNRNTQASTGPVIEMSDSYEIWEFWWENNKDQYLDLKSRLVRSNNASGTSGMLTGRGRKVDSRSTSRASRATINSSVIPSLIDLLHKSDNRDILDSA